MASLPDAPDHPPHGVRASGRTGGGACGASKGSGSAAADDQGVDAEGGDDGYDEDNGVAQPQSLESGKRLDFHSCGCCWVPVAVFVAGSCGCGCCWVLVTMAVAGLLQLGL
eukprot:7495-Chlamydomonas_euryale.AAC.3